MFMVVVHLEVVISYIIEKYLLKEKTSSNSEVGRVKKKTIRNNFFHCFSLFEQVSWILQVWSRALPPVQAAS